MSVVGPDDGETIVLGDMRTRVLEDGNKTSHRRGLAESVLAPHTPGPPFTNTTDQPAVMLSTFAPDLSVQHFRDLQDMIIGGQALTPQAQPRTMRRNAPNLPPAWPSTSRSSSPRASPPGWRRHGYDFG
ncbi:MULTISPECIES: hypothetical protein [unclassified Streptomyces]|uniref:hypothetical protein n=1 Tax=unclassified Streptomyces TaxID=2593676 RepID=UPI0036944F26